MTTLTFHLGRALGRGWGAGDEIVVTELDHHANVAPWQALARERGVTLRSGAARARDRRARLGRARAALSPRTRLLAIGAASNALGTINDVTRACALARAAGALSFVDAVHYAPHALVDVRAIGCDFLACSAYKFYGPHVGILYGRRERLEALDVPEARARAGHRARAARDRHAESRGHRGRRRGGRVPRVARATVAAPGATASARAFAALHAARAGAGRSAVDGAGRDRRRAALRAAAGPAAHADRGLHACAGRTTDEVATALAGEGVFVSNGDFYATTVVERLGLAASRPRARGLRLLHHRRRGRPPGRGRPAAGPLTAVRTAGLTGILTRVFSHSSTSVAPLPAPSLRMVNVSIGDFIVSLFTLARPTSCVWTSGV